MKKVIVIVVFTIAGAGGGWLLTEVNQQEKEIAELQNQLSQFASEGSNRVREENNEALTLQQDKPNPSLQQSTDRTSERDENGLIDENSLSTDRPKTLVEQVLNGPSIYDKTRSLEELSMTDPETSKALLNDLLAKGELQTDDRQIVTRGIYYLSENDGSLPDQELELMYHATEDNEVKRVSAMVFAERGDAALLHDYVGTQQTLLQSDNAEDRANALRHLGSIRNNIGVNDITQHLHDPDPYVRFSAITALSASGDKRHVEAIKALQEDEDFLVREAVSNTLDFLKTVEPDDRIDISRSDVKKVAANYFVVNSR